MRAKLTAGLSALFLSFFALTSVASAQSAPKHYLSAATNNSTNVTAVKAFLNGGLALNTNATIAFLKFYNKATAPTCGTDTPVWTIALPQNVPVPLPVLDANFGTGLGFCITGQIQDNDNTNATTGIVVNLGVSLR